MKKEVPEMTPEEQKLIAARRDLEERKKRCIDKIMAVLKEDGFSLKVNTNPQIILEPV